MYVFEEHYKCCGCESCKCSCPVKAITMREDEFGFRYPYIDETVCINCGLCIKVCGFNSKVGSTNKISSYAAVARDEKISKHSSSGGVFAVVAQKVLREGGHVVGCALIHESEHLIPKHIIVSSLDDLLQLSGSKYVQSFLGDIFTNVQELLRNGDKVLFTGTPCQIAGLYGFLGKEYNNLTTIDLICHGTPNWKIFDAYLKFKEKALHRKIIEVCFRDREIGWGKIGYFGYRDAKGRYRKKDLNGNESSYYSFFNEGELCRPSCYECPYASELRPADITLGDFWGIQKVHPDLLKKNGGKMNEKKGISCIVTNTERGDNLINLCKKDLYIEESKYKNIAIYNEQLCCPPRHSSLREEIIDTFIKKGYKGVDDLFIKREGINLLKIKLKNNFSHIKRCLRKLRA